MFKHVPCSTPKLLGSATKSTLNPINPGLPRLTPSTHSDCNATSAHQWVNSETQSFGATDTQEMAGANLLMRFEDFNGNTLGNTGIIRFDTLGRGYYQNVNTSGIGTQCSNGCKLVFTGENNAAVCIEAEGYVHACQ